MNKSGPPKLVALPSTGEGARDAAADRCVHCGTPAPRSPTLPMLVGNQFGWRLTCVHAACGQIRVDWHCPRCWRKRR